MPRRVAISLAARAALFPRRALPQWGTARSLRMSHSAHNNPTEPLPLAARLRKTTNLTEALTTFKSYSYEELARPGLVKLVEQHPTLVGKWGLAIGVAAYTLGVGLYFSHTDIADWYRQAPIQNKRTGLPLVEATPRCEKDTILDFCHEKNANVKFISISGAPGTGKSALTAEVKDKFIEAGLIDKLINPRYRLVWSLDASSKTNLLDSTQELIHALNIQRDFSSYSTDDAKLKAMINEVKNNLSQQSAWALIFENIDTMDLLTTSGWYSQKPNAEFSDTEDSRGVVIFVHRDNSFIFNSNDRRVPGRTLTVDLNHGLSHDEIAKMIKNICANRVDAAFVNDISKHLLSLPIKDLSYPLVASTIVHYLAYRREDQPAFDLSVYTMQLSSSKPSPDPLEIEYSEARKMHASQYPKTLRAVLQNILDNISDPSFNEFIFKLAFSPVHEFKQDVLETYANSIKTSNFQTLTQKAFRLGWISQTKDAENNTIYFIHPAIQKNLSIIATNKAWQNQKTKPWTIKNLTSPPPSFATFSAQFISANALASQVDIYQQLLGSGSVSRPEDLERTYQLFPMLDGLIQKTSANTDACLRAKLFYLDGMAMKHLSDERRALLSFDETIKLLERNPGKEKQLLADAYIQRAKCSPREGSPYLDKAHALASELSKEKQLDIELEQIKLLGMKGHYQQALRKLKTLRWSYQKIGSQEGEANTLYWQAFAQKTIGNYAEALQDYQACFDIRNCLFSDTPNHISLMEVEHDVGVTLRHLGRFPQAIAHLEKSVEATERFYGNTNPSHKHLAIAYHDLGLAYLEQGSWADFFSAKHYLEKGHAARIHYHGSEHPAVARSYESLGDLHAKLGHHLTDTAKKYYQQSLDIRLKNYGEEHPETARAFLKLAQATFEQIKNHSACTNQPPSFECTHAPLLKAKRAYQAYREKMLTAKKNDPDNSNITNMLAATDRYLKAIEELKANIAEQEKTLTSEVNYQQSISVSFS